MTELRVEESRGLWEDPQHRESADNSCQALHWDPARSKQKLEEVEHKRKTDCEPERVDTLDSWRFHDADHQHRYTVTASGHERFPDTRLRNLQVVRIVPAPGRPIGLHCQKMLQELQEEAIRDTKMSRQVGSALRPKNKACQEVVMTLWRTVACCR